VLSGARLRGEASVVSMACSLGTPLAVDVAQVLLDELIHPEKYS